MKQTHHMVVNACYLYTLVWALLSKHFNKFQPARTATINPNEKGNECQSAFFNSWHNYFHGVDEPHGSLFMYFRIFAPLADDHVIASHVTSVTRPIPTFSDQL
jgi:hypothetical protein